MDFRILHVAPAFSDECRILVGMILTRQKVEENFFIFRQKVRFAVLIGDAPGQRAEEPKQGIQCRVDAIRLEQAGQPMLGNRAGRPDPAPLAEERDQETLVRRQVGKSERRALRRSHGGGFPLPIGRHLAGHRKRGQGRPETDPRRQHRENRDS